MTRPLESLKNKRDLNPPEPSFDGLSKYFESVRKYVESIKVYIIDRFAELKKDVEGSLSIFKKGMTSRMEGLETETVRSLDEITDRVEIIDDLVQDSLTLNDNQHEVLTKEISSIKKYLEASFKDLSSRSSVSEAELSKIPQEIEKRVSSLRTYFSAEIKRLDDKDAAEELKSLWKLMRELEERIKKILKSDRGAGGTQVQVFQNGSAVALTYGINFKGSGVVANPIYGVDVTVNAPFPPMTTTARLALTPINGQTAYDTTLNTAMIYVNGYWATILIN